MKAPLGAFLFYNPFVQKMAGSQFEFYVHGNMELHGK
jgi:hypothetical protein